MSCLQIVSVAMKTQSLKSRIMSKISQSEHEVFLRSDFEKMSGYKQIGRVLNQLISESVLIRIGYGLYAKARLNRITGKPMVSASGGFAQVAEEALSRLDVDWKASKAVNDYQLGDSTQVPVNAEVVIKGRFRRKIGYGKLRLKLIIN
jgi:hypothetical protein